MYCIINNYQLCDILYYLIKYIVTNKQPPTNQPNLTDKQIEFLEAFRFVFTLIPFIIWRPQFGIWEQ